MGTEEVQEAISLGEISDKIDRAEIRCHFCEARLLGSAVESYGHDGGIEVVGFREKQWVYVHCVKCHYDWALWKILGDIQEGLSRVRREN